jgi:PAS domain S-box-containing protein
LLDSLSNTTALVIQQAQAEEALRKSENGFRQLFECSQDAIMVIELPSWRIISANPATVKMFGAKNEEEFLTYGPEDLSPDRQPDGHASAENAKERIETAIGKGSYFFEWTHQRIGGEEFPADVLLTPMEHGGKMVVQAIVRDITERKRAETELNHERYLLRSLMDNSDDSIYFKDLQSRFLRCSAAQMHRLQANGLSDVIGKTDHDFFSDEHASEALHDEQKILRTGEALVGKVEKETWPDGHNTWVLTSKMPLRNDAGQIVGSFGISKDITAIKEAEAKLNALHRDLLDVSRQAGMAEVATSVLHNVGNVLNSVNVAASLISEKVRQSKVSSLTKVVALLQSHEDDLPGFFAGDPKGKQLPSYLAVLATRLTQEQVTILREVDTLIKNIQHIKEVVSMQQNIAKTVGMIETMPVVDMVEDALRLNLGELERHDIKLVREYSAVPPVSVEKHKVLQILGNLVRNAKYACDDSGRNDKQIILRVVKNDDRVNVSIEDNGVGIMPENLTRIFGHGFTTRKEGHGFGLHSGALAAKDLGATLKAFSEGIGKGAIFTLELPLGRQKS